MGPTSEGSSGTAPIFAEGGGPHESMASGRIGTSDLAALRLVRLLLLAVAILPVAGRPLFNPDEGRYAEIGRAMLRSGDWLTPRLEGSVHLSKPPLAYWVAAAGEGLFGLNEVGARSGAALAFFLTGLVVVSLASRLYGSRTGWISGLVFGTSVLPFALGHFLSTDIFVTFWQALGVWAAVQAWSSPK